MTKTTTKQIGFDKLMVEFKKYVATSEARKALQHVYFDGVHFIATDSHTMLRVNKEYVSSIPSEVIAGSTYNPVKMELYTDDLHSYPDTDRLIPNDFNLRIRINNTINEIQKQLKFGQSLMEGYWIDKQFKFTAQDDFLMIEAINTIEGNGRSKKYEYIMKHNDYLESNGKEIVFTLGSKYIMNALVTAKKLSRLSTNDLEAKMISSLRPFVIGQSDVFDILVMPVRTF